MNIFKWDFFKMWNQDCCITLTYTNSQKFLNSKIFNVFLKNCSPSLHLFDPKYSKNSNIVKY